MSTAQMLGRCLVGAVILMTLSTTARGAPSADLWQRWAAHAPDSGTVVDHAAWDRFLTRYRSTGPDGIARVAYKAVTPGDRIALDAYLAQLSSVSVSALNRPEQKAYWINLYNALTVNVVLQHYPVESIRDINISPGFFTSGPWKKQLIRVENAALTLDDIEHRILRPGWGDPRVHYVLNCASLGCPNLPAEALRRDNLEPMLEAAAVAFVNHPRGVRVEEGAVVASKIYSWFRDDFGADDEAVLAHLRGYARGRLRDALSGARSIDRYSYDWALNDAP